MQPYHKYLSVFILNMTSKNEASLQRNHGKLGSPLYHEHSDHDAEVVSVEFDQSTLKMIAFEPNVHEEPHSSCGRAGLSVSNAT